MDNIIKHHLIIKIRENNLGDIRGGGAVLLDGYIYESFEEEKRIKWRCINWDSGEEMFVSRLLDPGCVIFADGMLYCYSLKGELALVKPNTTDFEIISQTKVEKGSSYHYSHIMINEGILYLRHGNALIAYKVS